MKKYTELSIIGILLISTVYSLITIQVTDYTVGVNFYLGLFVIILTCLIRVKKVKTSRYMLGIALLLGSFNLLAFSHIEFGFGFSIAGLKILAFNPVIAILLLFYLFVNGSELNKLLGEATQPTEEEKKVQLEGDIERFKNRFSNKSIVELQEVIDNPDNYVETAVVAAKALIEEK